MDSSVGPTKKAALSPFELSFLEFCSRKRSFGERISNSDRSYFYKCEFCPGKKLLNEDELEEHLDTLHTERTCSECGGNFQTKKAFDAHKHEPLISSKESFPLLPKPKPEKEELPAANKGHLLFDCSECSESFPTQFHMSTHIREAHAAIPQCSLPPKKRSSPLKNWPQSREEGSLEDDFEDDQPVTKGDVVSPSLGGQAEDEKDTSKETMECPSSPKKRRKKADLPPPILDPGATTTTRRNRARKNYTDIDLYLDESEEEAILQKILRQTSRLKRGRKSKNEYPLVVSNNNNNNDDDDESIKATTNSSNSNSSSDFNSDLLHKRDALSHRGRRRGRCKKI